jgi:hypothetical protein
VALLVRERMPLRLHATVETPSGLRRRWAPDERKPDYALNLGPFSNTIPGGFEQASATLARKIAQELPDIEELSTVTIRGVGGEIAWQGRLEGSPRTWGDQSSVQPALVGWQAHLDDNNTARMIYVDADKTRWVGPSVQRQINLVTAGGGTDTSAPSTAPDLATGYPSLVCAIQGPDSRQMSVEAWYDANGIDLGALYYAWKRDGVLDNTDTNWSWLARLSSDDLDTSVDATANLRAAGPGKGTLTATVAGRKWAQLLLRYNAAVPTNVLNQLFWTALAVYGNHGLALQGAGDYQNAPGLLASDIVAHAVSTWAPLLDFTTGQNGTIVPSTFVIPHLTFPDATTVSQIISGASAYDLQDWAVWDGPRFWWYPRGTYGRTWRTRTGDCQLQEAGPQISRLWNGVIVTYQDVTGVSRTVGPTGSGAIIEDASLLDTDPSNPCNQITNPDGTALRRWTTLQMGTSTSAAAIKVGQAFLAEQRLLDTSGQATLTGHVQDDATGIYWPAWMIRSGDSLRVVDSNDPSARRIIRAEFDPSTAQCPLSLDSPPDGMQQLLARLSVSLTSLGFS